MICTFFQKFYEACVLEGIAPVWDEENESRVSEVLNRMNFSSSVPAAKTKRAKESK